MHRLRCWLNNKFLNTKYPPLQSQLKELGGAVLEAQEEESKAKREEERAQQALKVAENEKNEARDQAKAAAKKIADLEAQLVQQVNKWTPGKPLQQPQRSMCGVCQAFAISHVPVFEWL